jgi:hypothetical protein
MSMDWQDLQRLQATIAEAIASGMEARSHNRLRQDLFIALAPVIVSLTEDDSSSIATCAEEIGLLSASHWDYQTHYPMLCAKRTREFTEAFFNELNRYAP